MTVQFLPDQHIHIIGVGGSGMSAIARLLCLRGWTVSGSDARSNAVTDALSALGVTVFVGHAATQVTGADMVIASSAIPAGHVEIATAHAQGIPVYRRMDVMSGLMAGYTGIAVAGTHGKTTTTSMVAHILLAAGQDPTYIVGGVMGNTGHNADAGQGSAFVIEADEYGNMFLGLRPHVAVLTSVEFDHPDFFTTEQALHDTFAQFLTRLTDDGVLIACADDAGARDLASSHSGNVVLYGIENGDWQARDVQYERDAVLFTVHREGQSLGSVTLRVPGQHNIRNALAAIVAADSQGITFAEAAVALGQFVGTSRRFEVRGEAAGIVVVDDYAHHPTAIRTTIEAARHRYPEHQCIAVWQPHTYSRTGQLWTQFLASFDGADQVVVTEIYAAREAHDPQVSSSDFVAQLQHTAALHAASFNKAVQILLEIAQAPAVVLIMSAGDAPEIGERLLQRLHEEAAQ